MPGEGHFAVTVDGVTVGLLVSDGDFQVTEEPPKRPTATFVVSTGCLAGMGLGVVSVEEALAAGDLDKGDADAALAVLRAFLTPLPAVPVPETA